MKKKNRFIFWKFCLNLKIKTDRIFHSSTLLILTTIFDLSACLFYSSETILICSHYYFRTTVFQLMRALKFFFSVFSSRLLFLLITFPNFIIFWFMKQKFTSIYFEKYTHTKCCKALHKIHVQLTIIPWVLLVLTEILPDLCVAVDFVCMCVGVCVHLYFDPLNFIRTQNKHAHAVRQT